jgi:cobalamin biosynthesis protein CbiG
MPRLWLGIGCRPGLAAEALFPLVTASLRAQGLSEAAVVGLASLDRRADEPAIAALAAALGVPTRFFSAERLEQETPRLAHPSAVVFAAIGCHGVAEAASLAAAGPAARLVMPKLVAGPVTLAASAEAPL